MSIYLFGHPNCVSELKKTDTRNISYLVKSSAQMYLHILGHLISIKRTVSVELLTFCLCVCLLLKFFLYSTKYLLYQIIYLLFVNGAPKLTSGYDTDNLLGQGVFIFIQYLFLHLLVSLFTTIFVYKY